LSSLIIFYLLRNINFNFLNKINFINKYSNDLFVLIIFGTFIPYTLCSYIYTCFKVSYKNYIISSALGPIPGTLSITYIFSHVKYALNDLKNNEFNIYKEPSFIISILLFLILLFIIKKLKNKYSDKIKK